MPDEIRKLLRFKPIKGSIIFFKDGNEVDRMVGAAGKDVFTEKLNALLA